MKSQPYSFFLSLDSAVTLKPSFLKITAGILPFLRLCFTVLFLLVFGGTHTVAAEITATYTTGAEVALTSSGYSATGNTVNVSLNYAPPVGTQLLVVKNTGIGFINGTFSNLAQGQTLPLTYNGMTYEFVANYYGGNGNDLVLVWKATNAYAWGFNNSGQIGNNSNTNSLLPTAVTTSGVLYGKTVVAVAAGVSHSLALCSDGTVAAWGKNEAGQLGNGTITDSSVPVAVTISDVLAGKTVVGVAAGWQHSLALCSDGTVAAWGNNYRGQLGYAGSDSWVPVAVAKSGVLAGKVIVSLVAGYRHNVALCSDGTVVTWGSNWFGALGDNTSPDLDSFSSVPVVVTRTGVLAGKTVISVAAGFQYSLALCSDGTVTAWGHNGFGQLGIDTTTTSTNVPVGVMSSAGLAGKVVMNIAAGYGHSMALCSDGTVVTWGYNANGELGNGTTISSSVPVTVDRTGLLAGKNVVVIASGCNHSMALCSDGTLATWGYNGYGALGNNTKINSSVPVAVSRSFLPPGDRFLGLFSGSLNQHSLALVARTIINPTFSGVTQSTANLGGTVINDGGTAITGRGIVYAPTAINRNPMIGGAGVISVPASGTTGTFTVNATNLTPGTSYTFAAYASNSAGTGYSITGTFVTVPSSNPDLSGLLVSAGPLLPVFNGGNTSYTMASVPNSTSSIIVTPIAAQGNATIKVNNKLVTSGTPSGVIMLNVGSNTITTVVTAQDGITTKTYTVTVNRAAIDLRATYTIGSEVPLTVNNYSATGSTVSFTLNYAPAPGTQLMVVNNTGIDFINGSFSNLIQGQAVPLAHNGLTYYFVANYYGGTGNDLVLYWKATHASAWGNNAGGRLGNNSTTNSSVPVPVASTGVLAGKTVMAVSAGGNHSLALCSDGSVAAWGSNSSGMLGNNSALDSSVPVAVMTSGVLAGKTVVAVAAGGNHSLALCSDGTVVAWGNNGYGQLGNTSTTDSSVPVLISSLGVLANKTVVAISAGWWHSMALCSDGTVIAWGRNYYGELGNSTKINSSSPVAVTSTGVLMGKSVMAISAGASHSVALCSDGTLSTWGNNDGYQLGNNSSASSTVPVSVVSNSVLLGKTVVSVAAGWYHNVALCSDGTVVAWGDNSQGQMGNNGIGSATAPTAVNNTGVLAGKAVVSVAAGGYFNMLLCSDGTLASWGYNLEGNLGNNSTTLSRVPVLVTTTTLTPGERFIGISRGSLSFHSLALVAESMVNPTALDITATTATLGGTILSDGGISITERGVVYAPTATNSNPEIGGVGVIIVPTSGTTGAFTVNATNLTPGTAYTFVPYVSNGFGTGYSRTSSFTTLSALSNWRQTWYGTITNTGNAGDNADPYRTGVPNLLVFAFFGSNQNPATAKASNLPQVQLTGGSLNYIFTEPLGVSGQIIYGAEWSTTLAAGSWQAVPDTGTPPQHIFSMPMGANTKLFMRLRVTNP
jgi:alpha-tubulin suppressor-like RCC1 family protein